MRGIEVRAIGDTWAKTSPPGARPFDAFFQPILPSLARFHWFCEPRLPFARDVEHDDEAFDRVSESVCLWPIPPGTLLPKFVHYVMNDWADLYGFCHPPPAEVQRSLQRGNVTSRQLSKVADICFFNVDGAYSEVYAKDDQTLNKVVRHVARLPGVTAVEKQLETRDRAFEFSTWQLLRNTIASWRAGRLRGRRDGLT